MPNPEIPQSEPTLPQTYWTDFSETSYDNVVDRKAILERRAELIEETVNAFKDVLSKHHIKDPENPEEPKKELFQIDAYTSVSLSVLETPPVQFIDPSGNRWMNVRLREVVQPIREDNKFIKSVTGYEARYYDPETDEILGETSGIYIKLSGDKVNPESYDGTQLDMDEEDLQGARQFVLDIHEALDLDQYGIDINQPLQQ